MLLYHEPTVQFLARMILATREGHQIGSKDAQRLADHANYGQADPPTMPEERRDGSKPLQPIVAVTELVQ